MESPLIQKNESLLSVKKNVKNLTSLSNPSASFAFKLYMVVSMVFFWSFHTLLVRYTRSSVFSNKMYSSATVVFMGEVLKIIVSLILIFKEAKFSIQTFFKTIKKYLIDKPFELAKVCIPSITYALQNNLEIIALSNLDAGVFQVNQWFKVTSQLKIVSTAIFMILFLRRKFSLYRWLSIFLLFFGVAIVQFSNVEMFLKVEKIVLKNSTIPVLLKTLPPESFPSQNSIIGLVAVLCTCVTAGFAGVYFEMMLKDNSMIPFWVRNLQLYSCGVVSALMGCFLSDSLAIQTKGFFYGYTVYVWLTVVVFGCGGIFISLVMKYLDNLHKSFASSVSIIFVVLFSVFVLNETNLTVFFVLGSIVVCFAIILYNSVDE